MFFSTYSLGQWTALANGDLVTLLNTECWGDVGSEVLVALLVTSVLWNKVEVLATDDEGAVHLGGDDGAGEDTATDGDLAGEWALLVWRVHVSICAVGVILMLPSSWNALEISVLFVASIPTKSLLSPRPANNLAQQTTPCISLRIPDSASISSRILPCRHTNVVALNGGLWGLEAQSDVLVPSATSLASAGGLDLNLGVEEDVWLLLEGALSLDGQFGGHFCGWWMSRWSKVVRIEVGLVVVELLLHRGGRL